MSILVLAEPQIEMKLRNIEAQGHHALLGQGEAVPDLPARDIEVRPLREHPPKVGLSSAEAQARLMHDLASIELQAMELALRTLLEFPEASSEFRQELHDLMSSEARHLRLCLEGLTELGFQWGDWPVHLGLWQATSAEDTILDRVLIVHRYLEGSGLDAGESILRRLKGVDGCNIRSIVDLIVREEIDHVAFGSRWYRRLCESSRLDPDVDFRQRMPGIIKKVPRREKISHRLRKAGGYTDSELEFLEEQQQNFYTSMGLCHLNKQKI